MADGAVSERGDSVSKRTCSQSVKYFLGLVKNRFKAMMNAKRF